MTAMNKDWWEDEYYDVSALKSRSWTEGMITNLLGEPDEWASVDHFYNYTGKRIYRKSRVHDTESSSRFLEMLKRSVQRRKLSKAERKKIIAKYA